MVGDDTSQGRIREGTEADDLGTEAADLELEDEQAEDVRGGKTPSPPGGPQPIPYPN